MDLCGYAMSTSAFNLTRRETIAHPDFFIGSVLRSRATFFQMVRSPIGRRVTRHRRTSLYRPLRAIREYSPIRSRTGGMRETG